MRLLHVLLSAAGGILLFGVAGTGVVSWVPELRALPLLRRLAYQYLFGVATVAGLAWTLSHLAGVPLRRSALLPLALAPAALALCARWRRRARSTAVPLPRVDRVLARAVFVAISILFLGLIAEAVSEPVHDFDGVGTWDVISRWIRDAGTVDAQVLQDRRFYVNHPDYPILLPLSQVVVHEVLSTEGDDRIVRPIYAAFFPALLLVLLDGATRLAGRRAGYVAVLAVALVPAYTVWTTDGGGCNSTYSDVPLACFVGGGLVLLLRRNPSLQGGLAAGVLLGAGLLTKSEGLPLAVLTFLAAAFATGAWTSHDPGGSARAMRARCAAAMPILLSAILLASWRSGIPRRFTERYDIPSPGALLRALAGRLPLLPGPITKEMADVHVWGGFWFVALPILVLGREALRRRPLRPILLALAGAISLYLTAYAITPWPGAVLVHPTWNRFLLQLSIPGGMILAAALRPLLRTIPRRFVSRQRGAYAAASSLRPIDDGARATSV